MENIIETMLQIAWNIKLIRVSAGLTQGKFAEKIGSSKDQIFLWENEKSTPNTVYCEKIAAFAGITIQDLQHKKLKEGDLDFERQLRKSNFSIPKEKATEITPGKMLRMQAMLKVIVELNIELIAHKRGVDKAKVQAEVERLTDTELLNLLHELE